MWVHRLFDNKQEVINRIVAFALVVCSITLCSCNKEYDIPSESKESSNADRYSWFEYNQEKEQVHKDLRLAVSPDGYYYVVNNILFHYNVNDNFNSAVCSNVACNHNDTSCGAYVSTFIDTSDHSCTCSFENIFYYNGKIYMIESVKDADFYLTEYDSDFNNVKRIAKLASYSEDKTRLWGDERIYIRDGYAYYLNAVYSKETMQEDGYRAIYNCMRVKIEENAVPEMIGTFDGSISISPNMKITGNKDYIYYIMGWSDNPYAQSDSVLYKIARYSVKEEKYEMLVDYLGDTQNNYFSNEINFGNFYYYTLCVDDDNNMYFVTCYNDSKVDNCVARINLDTGEKKVIYTFVEGYIEQLYYDGNYIYLSECKSESGGDKSQYTQIRAIDKDGKLISKMKIEYSDEVINRMKENPLYQHTVAGWVYILGIDDRGIILGATENGYKGLSSSGSNSSNKKYKGVGFVDKNAFLNGENPDIIQIYK